MKVLTITNNLKQASFRLRIASLVEGLARAGIDLDIQVRPRKILARRRLLRSAARYDAVLLQRKMLDPLDARLLRRFARNIFFDVDDTIMFHNRDVSTIARWRTTRRFRATAKYVDRVVAGNQYIADIFRARGAQTVVIPTVVDPSHYQIKTHQPIASPTLVWIGSKSTLPYLRSCLPSIAVAAEKIPGLRLLTISDVTLPCCPVPLEHIPWSTHTEAEAPAADIGIAPTPEDRWTLGKCGFKIIQYMAAGLPVIASPVGANSQIVQHEKTGLLVEETEEWSDAIERLAGDCQVRACMGAAARARVQENYSIDRALTQWAQILQAAVSPIHSAARD